VQALADAVMARRHGDDWRAKFERPTPAAITHNSEPVDYSKVTERAIAYINSMPGAISGSGGHNATFAAANVVAHGFALDEATSIAILRDHHNGKCDPPWSESELAHKVRSAMSTADHNNPRGHLRDTARERERVNYGVDLSGFLSGGLPAAIAVDEPFTPNVVKAEPFPMHLIDVPGFIGDVIKYNLETAYRPQPILALGAAIALQGVLAGRKVRDGRGNRTNLYIVGIAHSSAGKDHARQINKDILAKSGLGSLEGNEDIASDAGLFSAVEASPAVLFQIDEFGRFLKCIGDAKRNPHMYATLTMFMRMFSSAKATLKGKAYADKTNNKEIIQPCACIYGTTVPSNFYESLTKDSMSDGFVGRMFAFESDLRPPPCDVDEIDVPEGILARARYWGEYKPTGGNLQHLNPEPTRVIASPEAKAMFRAFGDSFEVRMIQQGNEIETSIWGRAVEKAMRLALVHACSRSPEDLAITVEDAAWACELSAYLTRRMMHTAGQWVSEGQFDETQKRVLRIIGDAGGIMPQWDLNRKTRWLKKRDRDDLIANMLDTNQIKKLITTTNTKPRVEYAII